MGDVPLLTVISQGSNRPQEATEYIQGVASGTKIAFRLDGARTNYLDYQYEELTESTIRSEFLNLFNIRCPPSLNNPQASPLIVYVNEFENSDSYDQTSIINDMAFCGHSAFTASNGSLVEGNMQTADYMCFAYKVVSQDYIIMHFFVQSDEDPPVMEEIQLDVTGDSHWHYRCLNLRQTLQEHDYRYLSVTTFVIQQIYINSYTPSTVNIDTFTLRNSMPIGYEEEHTNELFDQSSIGQCTFPFLYNGQNHSSCIIDENNMPFCGFISNVKLYCQNSSVEGVRRLRPRHQLLVNSLHIIHTPINYSIDFTFLYMACESPSLIEVLPSTVGQTISISNASQSVSGFYSIIFIGNIYPSIPVIISEEALTNRLQYFPDFGYVQVTRESQCYQYNYTIEWLASGPQPMISIASSSEVTPQNAPLSVRSIRRGSLVQTFYNLPNDVLRTYHTTPQVSSTFFFQIRKYFS